MILIGMLHHRKNPENVVKSYAYAAVARAEGAELIYFSPKCVDVNNRRINGYIYQNGGWQKVERPFPDVIYNAGSPEKLAAAADIINRLREEIPFTTNSVGNKMRVYKRLQSDGEFSAYLIPSEIIHSSRSFFDFLNSYKKIVFKPVNGHKGEGIVFIERVQDEFHLLIGTDKIYYSFDKLKSFVSNKIRKELHLVQPYINCRTKAGLSYDFRLHIQKNGEGKWTITTIYPRIGPEGSIVSNISYGGATNYLDPFLKQEFGEHYYDIRRYLEQFSLQLANKMDEIQQSYFLETIDELGIDVALDDMGKIWIYEVNWRPGCPPTFYLELDVVRNQIRYAIFLAKKQHENLLELEFIKNEVKM